VYNTSDSYRLRWATRRIASCENTHTQKALDGDLFWPRSWCSWQIHYHSFKFTRRTQLGHSDIVEDWWSAIERSASETIADYCIEQSALGSADTLPLMDNKRKARLIISSEERMQHWTDTIFNARYKHTYKMRLKYSSNENCQIGCVEPRRSCSGRFCRAAAAADSPDFCTWAVLKYIFLPRDAMQALPMPSCGVCLSVCVSVTFVHSVKTNKHNYLQKIFIIG